MIKPSALAAPFDSILLDHGPEPRGQDRPRTGCRPSGSWATDGTQFSNHLQKTGRDCVSMRGFLGWRPRCLKMEPLTLQSRHFPTGVTAPHGLMASWSNTCLTAAAAQGFVWQTRGKAASGSLFLSSRGRRKKSHRPIVLSWHLRLTMAAAERGVDRKQAVIFVAGLALSTHTANCLGPGRPRPAAPGLAEIQRRVQGSPSMAAGSRGDAAPVCHMSPQCGRGRWEGTKVPLTSSRISTYGLCARPLAQSGKDCNPGSLSRPRSGSKSASSTEVPVQGGGVCFLPVNQRSQNAQCPHALVRNAISRNRGLALDVGLLP
jgi:hypothetical protein